MRLDPAIRLRHVATFVEVARAGSVGRAADRLAVTQPAVSKTIKELESILGVELLDRSRRTIALTPYGRIFLRHAEASLVSLRQGVEEIAGARAPGAAPLRIGALPTVSARLLPGAVRRVLAHGLGAPLRIVTGPNAHLMSQLREGAIDIVIGRMGEAAEMTGFAFEPLYSETIRFVVRPGHPLLAAGAFDPMRLAEFELLTPPEGAVIRPVVERLMLAAGLPPPRAVLETVSTAFGRAYVRGSDAVWVISEGVVLGDVEEGTLATLPIDTSQTLGPVGITLRSGAAVGPAMTILLQELRNAASALREAAADRLARPG